MSKTLLWLENKNKSNLKYEDLPVGTDVKIVAPCQDHYFFYGETGKVIENTGRYLGVTVKFDKPRHFEDGYVQTEFSFNPEDLQKL